jgi:4-methylaminobutanoate oxidase (formaldehyde-forming)
MVGKDVASALSWIASNEVTRPPGSLVYTQMLNARGGIECDLTLARIETDAYYIVTGTGFATHDLAWIGDHIPENMDARLVDVTSARAVLSLMGPKAREVLAAVTDADVSNTAFPFGTVREIAIAGASVRALRITYVGELGWELHIPAESAGAVYDRLMEAGRPLGLVNAGYRAIESLRLEKGYRAWGSDIGPDHTPLEAGLGWAVKLKGNRPFLGREALDAQARAPLTKRLACFTVEDPAIVLLGRETIFRDGRQAGWLTSGGWGYTVAKSIGYGYVRNPDGVTPEYLTSGSYELEVACERVPAQIHLAPLYDPKNERVRG